MYMPPEPASAIRNSAASLRQGSREASEGPSEACRCRAKAWLRCWRAFSTMRRAPCLLFFFAAAVLSHRARAAGPLPLPPRPAAAVINHGGGDAAGAGVGSAASTRRSALLATLPPIALAAFSTAAIMYPVDLVRALKMASVTAGRQETTLQLLQGFRAAHGVQGFFTQGLVPEVARATWMRALKFFLFPVMHEVVAARPPSAGTGASKALAGIMASVPETLTIMPLEISKICLQLDKAKVFGNSMFAALRDTVDRCGPRALFTGYVGVQYRQASWTAGYFASLSFFKRKAREALDAAGLEGKAEPAANLLGGFAAGVFGACFNTPGDVIRTNVQKVVLAGEGCQAGFSLLTGPSNFFSTGSSIAASRGLGGLYAGFGFKALHLGGSGALMALLVPTFKKLLNVDYD